MKLAVIAPPQMVYLTQGLGYHMVLGQELFRDAHYYEQYLTYARRGHFILVDNGAAEGTDVPFEDIAHAAIELGADEIILPDVLRNYPATLDKTLDGRTLDLVPPRKRMVVPQGANWTEWSQCLIKLVLHAQPVTIGVAKWLEVLPGGRPEAIKTICNLGYHKQCHIHLLGIHTYPFREVIECAKVYPLIRGIDTGAPIAYAQNNASIGDGRHFSLQWKAGDVALTKQNIDVYNHFIGKLQTEVTYGSEAS